MSLSIGIVGLPNAGKSTLFNSLVKNNLANAQNYPFCTIDPNVGIVSVPDKRLQVLFNIVKKNYPSSDSKIISATVKFVDIAGLVKNAHKGEGLGNQFLAHIRETDLIVMLLRVFPDENIIHVNSKIDPKDDMETLITELELSDLEVKENSIKLADKPKIYVANCSSDQLDKSPVNFGLPENTLLINAQTGESVDKLIKTAYVKLNLITFFTAGPVEIHAWTCEKGATAPMAAGKIHTDFQHGFIRAEIIAYDDYIRYNGENGAKQNGKLRVEGKDYQIQDGDVVHFRHSS
ncbi:MAG: GTP-dependent nucleic acid-binding protein EngD [Candidatus Berkelbacteria bacterium Licking1014_85]|uniref:GTP-dependent nucleic acid-binding protein EngD n=1 Tax=Candidatus Berkelbacteria bacterium Licking1014_85 TaxID=2017148 RepID=A0A554LI30_9BACT|nr:MAG: GTP-dependent nucleic acid-binding protein EngD [Candidatus Berkelbacteria bacterium Licking1014_85]